MALMVPIAKDGSAFERFLSPGDILGGGESALAGTLNTNGAGVWTGAAIATGIIKRTVVGAGFTDTTDTATNIIAALAGNGPQAAGIRGQTFRFLFRNSVAFAHTFAAGVGVVAGDGTLNSAASAWHEYLVTILCACAPVTLLCNTVNANALVTFVLPANTVALPFVGSNGLGLGAISDLVGATISGTGVTAGTTVLGITQGQGGAIGVTMSANATATSGAVPVSLSFGPTVQFDSLRAGIVI